MAHGFVRLGVFLFLVLSVTMLFTQSGDFFENITGNVVFSENVTEILNESTEEVIVILKAPLEEEYSVMGDEAEEEIEDLIEEVLEDLVLNETAIISSGGFTVEVNESVLEEIEDDSRVAFVEPVRYFDISLSEAIPIINASEVWAMNGSGQNLTGLGQTVCVIDTGINYSHVDLIGRNMTTCNMDCIDGPCVENCSETDLNGHGTHVTGIVAASGGVTGVAPGANFIGMKVFPDSSRSGASTTGIKNAIDWCVDNSETYNISVITMSLGTSSPFLYDSYCDDEFPSFNLSITDAYDKNISVTVSTGNEGNTTHISSPACVSKAIPVADTYDANIGGVGWGDPLTCTDDTTDVDQIVCHANRNSLLRLLAPGALISSTWYNGGYYSAGGTSMAAPMVAGAIAVMNQFLDIAAKNETPVQIEDRLDVSGKVISSGNDDFSRINLYDTIQFMELGVTLDSPENGNVTDVNVTFSYDLNFTCNSSSIYDLENVTFYLWNSTGNLTYNESLYVSGFENSSVFNYTISINDTYTWNCLVFNNNTDSGWADDNFTLTLNATNITETVIEVVDDPVVDNSGSGGSSSGGSTPTPVVEVNETVNETIDEVVNDTIKESDVPDEEVAEYFIQEEEPRASSGLSKVLTSSGSKVAIVLVIVVVGVILYRAKKIKRRKTKK